MVDLIGLLRRHLPTLTPTPNADKKGSTSVKDLRCSHSRHGYGEWTMSDGQPTAYFKASGWLYLRVQFERECSHCGDVDTINPVVERVPIDWLDTSMAGSSFRDGFPQIDQERVCQ